MDFEGNCVPFGPRGGGRRRRSVRSGVVRSIGLFVLALASVAALPPYCTPIPTEAVADLHEDCIRPLCDPASGACAFAQRLPDGTPCADGMGVCASGRCDCRAACGERVCGPDGCGGSCGACAEEEFCSVGECIPEGVGPGPHPQLVVNFPAAAQAIAVKGDTGYLGAGDHLFVLDLSDPERPRELGRVALPAPPMQLVPDPRRPYVYVAFAPARGLGIVDVSRRRAPRLLDTALSERAVYPRAWGGDILYANSAGPDPEGGADRYYLSALTFEDPRRPVVQDLPEGTSIGTVIHRGYSYKASSDGLHVVDLGDPLAPQTVRVVPLPGDYQGVLALTREHLLWAGSSLAVFDLSDPAEPRLRSSAPIPHWDPQGGSARGLAVVGDMVYVAGDCVVALYAFDLRDPDAPVLLQRSGVGCEWYRYVAPSSYRLSIAATATAAWLAYGPNGLQGWLQDEPGAAPRRAGTFHTLGVPVSLSEHEGVVVVASSRPGITLLDVSGAVSPTASMQHPEIVGVFEIEGPPRPFYDGTVLETVQEAPSVRAAVAENGRVYAGYGEELLVLGLEDPTRPELLGALPVGFTFEREGVIAAGEAAGEPFVAYAPFSGGEGVLTVLRGDVPTSHETCQIEAPPYLRDAEPAGEDLFLLAPEGLVRVDVAVTPPRQDVLWTFSSVLGRAHLRVTPSAFWLTDHQTGVRVLLRGGSGAPVEEHELAPSDPRGFPDGPAVGEPFVYVPYGIPPSYASGYLDVVRAGAEGQPTLANTVPLTAAPSGSPIVVRRYLLVPNREGIFAFAPSLVVEQGAIGSSLEESNVH